MYYPSTRLLSILELLRSHGHLTGAALAEHLEVDVRTVRRYVTMLQDLGMPIETERGRYGGYRLRPNYRLPPIAFSEDEVLALALGLLFARRLGGAGTVRAAESAIAKMERVLPDGLREQVGMMNETLAMRVPLPGMEVVSETVMTLSLATHRNQRVWLRYRAANQGESHRKVDPYSLVHTLGMWYVVGHCHLRQALRTFRLDRIVEVDACDEVFAPPDHFDALEFVEDSIAHTPSGWLCEVLLLTTMEHAKRLIPPATAMLEPDPQGVAMRCFVDNLDRFALFLAGLDCPLVVRGPTALHEALATLAARAAGLVDSAREKR